MDQMLIVLKYTGSFFAACYGVYATLTDFRPEKDGKKRLSRKGYFGIGLLVLSSVLALSADGLNDYKENQEKQAAGESERRSREAARVRDERITARLTEQLTRLEGLSSSFTVASEKLDANSITTNKISSNLRIQLNATGRISHQLGKAVNELNRTSKTTNAVLGETVDRVDSLDVYLEVLVDPLAMKDSTGASILSSDSRRLLEEDKAGTIDLSEEETASRILRELVARYNDVRRSVFSNWSAGVYFFTDSDQDQQSYDFFDLSGLFPDMIAIQQGDSGVTGFFIAGFSDEAHNFDNTRGGYKALVCFVKYSIPPNRYVGIRKFTDLNGAEWTVHLVSDGGLLKLRGALLSVGGTFGGPGIEMSAEDVKSKERGVYEGKKEIPADHFKQKS